MWDLLDAVAPELAAWSAYFADAASLRSAVDAGRFEELSPGRAEQALFWAEDFVDAARAAVHGRRGPSGRARAAGVMSRAPRSAAAERDRGRDEDGCSILHVDLDAFFASVELARRPAAARTAGRRRRRDARGRARGDVRGPRARRARRHARWPTALRLCPHAIVVPPDHHAYHEVSAG